jgi:hypothetical protein
LNFLQRLETQAIRPAARDYYVRWAEAWINARGNRSADTTSAYFDALGRSTHLADWQFRQAVDAARILACEVLSLPWASAFDWQGLAAQAHQLEPDHRTHGREAIPVRALLPTPPSDPAAPLPETGAEIERIVEALRRAIRLANLTDTTEQNHHDLPPRHETPRRGRPQPARLRLISSKTAFPASSTRKIPKISLGSPACWGYRPAMTDRRRTPHFRVVELPAQRPVVVLPPIPTGR